MKAIAAMSLNRVIGFQNRIPWHYPADLAWFKQITMGGILLMGRKTFDAIGRPLPGRETRVITRGNWLHPGVTTVSNLEALAADDPRELFVCGGAEIYAQLLPLCTDIYLTIVNKEIIGDAFFPEFEHRYHLKKTILEKPEFVIRHYQANFQS